MNDHISKPIDPEMLFVTVGRFYVTANSGGAANARGATKGVIPQAGAMDTLAVAPPSEGKGAGQRDGQLPVIDGLDTKDGLTRVAGNRKLYMKLLGQFVEQQGPSLEQIAAAMGKGETALAERLAHTLKGVAGNIGAKAVQAAAGVLEKLIREKVTGAELASASERAGAVLEPLIRQLRLELEASSPAGVMPTGALAADPEKSRAAAAHLDNLLAECDPGAADFVEASRAVLQPLFPGDGWAAFEKLVQEYAFADAQATLELASTKIWI